VLLFYTIYFGSREDEYGQSLFFVTLLLPITMATTYLLLYWLIPNFLLRGKVAQFCLYVFYVTLVSLYLELLVLVGLYITVADYQALFVSPTLVDLMDVLIGMYIVVLGAVSLHFLGKWRDVHSLNTSLSSTVNSAERKLHHLQQSAEFSIMIRVDRQDVRVFARDILWVESLRDYVRFVTTEEELLSKITLASIQDSLAPHGFSRIHRSYLVRNTAIDAFSSDSVSISGNSLPIGRSYRKSVQALKAPISPV